jgi:hypothetical protein
LRLDGTDDESNVVVCTPWLRELALYFYPKSGLQEEEYFLRLCQTILVVVDVSTVCNITVVQSSIPIRHAHVLGVVCILQKQGEAVASMVHLLHIEVFALSFRNRP